MLYINNLAAQVTGNMMPGETSIALGRHTEQDSIMVKDGGDCEDFLVRCYQGCKRSERIPRMTTPIAPLTERQAWKALTVAPSDNPRTASAQAFCG